MFLRERVENGVISTAPPPICSHCVNSPGDSFTEIVSQSVYLGH